MAALISKETNVFALDNTKLLRLIRFAPVGVILIFSAAVTIIAIQDNQDKAAHSIENLRQELLLERQDVIRSQVNQVYNHLILEESKIKTDLRQRAKQRVYEAYSIAHNIYSNNPNSSKSELLNLISEALRPIRFFNGRGYFFILDTQGKVVMHSLNPHREGRSSWDLQDKDGNYFVRNLVNATHGKGEGFLQWNYEKPGGEPGKGYSKIGFVKRFEPFDWIIGTGDYINDATNDAKADLLDWFSKYQYGDDGHFFVITNDGKLISHHQNDFFGVNMQVGNNIESALLDKILKQVNQGGGFIHFQKPLTLSGKVMLDQVSYVRKFKDWDWIFGTGFYSQTFERQLRYKAAELEAYNQQSLKKLILVAVFSTILLVIVLLYISQMIARRFNDFQQRIMFDFKELNDTKNRMEFMALHDALTGLPNRAHLIKDVGHGITNSARHGKQLAILFADLDNFKNINDLHGHAVGDKLLNVVSEKFQSIMEHNDTVYRFGGDEFVFCFTNIDSIREIYRKIEKIQEVLTSPTIIDGRILHVDCSIGVSTYPENSDNAESLIRMSDTALYRAKSMRKGSVIFYDNAIKDEIDYTLKIEQELTQALARNEISLCYQPQVETSTGKVKGVEALARWHNKNLGFVPPDKFIAVAEDIGTIHSIGLFIFRKACVDIVSLSRKYQHLLSLSINVSPIQLMDSRFCDQVFSICQEVGINPNVITLEITENIFIYDLDVAVMPVLKKLRGMGFGVSLDDFGTGYSSLRYVNNLPLTEIKIDRTFTSSFLTSNQSDMLVKMIIGIAHSCGLVIVAEGVETEEEQDKLLKYQCHLVQGYLHYKPLTLTELDQYVFKGDSEKGISQ